MHILPAVPISSLNDLENDKEELQGKQSINYMGLHRKVKHGVRRILLFRLAPSPYPLVSVCESQVV